MRDELFDGGAAACAAAPLFMPASRRYSPAKSRARQLKKTLTLSVLQVV